MTNARPYGTSPSAPVGRIHLSLRETGTLLSLRDISPVRGISFQERHNKPPLKGEVAIAGLTEGSHCGHKPYPYGNIHRKIGGKSFPVTEVSDAILHFALKKTLNRTARNC